MKGWMQGTEALAKGILIFLIMSGGMVEMGEGGRYGQAFAETFHVSADGSDGNSGSISRPWASIQFAVRHAGGGDEVLVRGGTYEEEEIWIQGDYEQGGKEGRLLTIRAYPGEKPLFVNGKRPFIIEGDHIRVEGLHFSNGKSLPIRGIRRKDIQLVKNHFSGKGYSWAAIHATGSDILLEGNVCDIQGNIVGTQGHCYYISHGSNLVIRNNVARGPTGYGIHVFDQRRGEDPPGFERLIKNVIIEGNTASNSLERCGIIIAAYDHARVENVTIRNNVIFDNAGFGIFIPGIAKDIFVYHNTIYGNRGPAALFTKGGGKVVENLVIRNNIFDLSGIERPAGSNHHVVNENRNSSIILENNLYWPRPSRFLHISDRSPITGNPYFRDVAGKDFRLKEGSAAIDRGINSSEAGADKDGTRRPQGRASDLGAYEYVPTSAR